MSFPLLRGRRVRAQRPAPLLASLLAAALGAVLPGLAWSGEDAAAPILAIELNKLEQQGEDCLAYLVFSNQSGRELTMLALELVLFDSDGFILRRLIVDAAPLDAGRTSVKLFEVGALQCAQLGRILLNEVVDCASADGLVADCSRRLELSSRGEVQLFQ